MMKFKIPFLLFLFIITFLPVSEAKSDKSYLNNPENKIKLSLPLVEAPFNFIDGYNFPGMNQSLDLTTGFYQLSHYTFLKNTTFENDLIEGLSLIGFNVLLSYIPLGDSWLHEEWHRAIMSHRKISSYNEVYDFKFFAESIKVKNVTDGDLIRLKKDYPKDMVRMSTAGMEAQNQLVLKLEKEIFFDDRNYYYQIPILFNLLNNIFYMDVCRSYKDSQKMNDSAFHEEGKSIKERDFTGLDCLGYVYDLFRPNEPYEARGVHPYGVGIKRYISFADLSNDERHYLKRVTKKTFLNLVSPFALLRNPVFSLGSGAKYSFSMREFMTSFGDSLDFNFFYKYQKMLEGTFILHHYSNFRHQFLGLETELFYSFEKYHPELRLMIWDQPSTLDVRSGQSKLGGLLGLKLNYDYSGSIKPYFGFELKSEGWVAGNPFLEKNLTSLIGVIIN